LLAAGSWVGAAASRSVLTPTSFYQLKNFVSKTSSSTLPLLLPKNYTDAVTQSLSQTKLEKRRQNFDRTKILPKETDISKGRKISLKTSNFVVNYH